jgi:hypothetical protein
MNKGAHDRLVRRVAARATYGGLIVLGVAAIGSTGAPSRVAESLEADLFSLFQERSPGARANGALVQSKPISRAAPTERVLSSGRRRPSGPPAPASTAQAGPASLVVDPLTGTEPPAFLAFGGVPSFPLDAAATGPGAASSPAGFGFGGSPFVVSGPGGGGAPGVSPEPVAAASPVPEVASAVPEPATWVTLLLGFGMVGIGLRAGARSRKGSCSGRAEAAAARRQENEEAQRTG